MSNKVGRDESGEGSTPKKRLKTRSEVWEHFTKINNGTGASCHYCNKEFSLKWGTTTHLKRHLKSCKEVPHGGLVQPLNTTENYERAAIEQPPTTACEDVVGNFGATQRPPTRASKGDIRNFGPTREPPTTVFGGMVRNSCSTQEVDREIHVKNAILIDLPFLSPNIRKAWSSPIGMDMEKEIFAYHQWEKDKLLTEFGRLTSRVCFSIETMKKAGWISITAHFINSDFNLVKKLIAFKKLPDVSSKLLLYQEAVRILESCISDWKLENKIFSATTDDFDLLISIETSESKLFDWVEMIWTCFKKDVGFFYYTSISDFWFDDGMNKIIKFVLDVMQSYHKRRKFNEITKEKGLPLINEDWLKGRPMAIQRDGDADDWKFCCSAVKMFKDASLYKEVFEQCVLTKIGEEPFSELDLYDNNDWAELEEEVDRFEAIKSIIDLLSNFKYPTSNLHIQSRWKLFDQGIQVLNRTMNRRMQYEDNFLYVACVLDPRYNLRYLKYIGQRLDDLMLAEEQDSIRDFLEEQFSEYAEEQTNQNSTRTENPSETIDEFSLYIKELKASRIFEMEKYLAEEPIDTQDANFDLLGWWKENRLRYPTWSRMARDYLAIPSCVYSVEENLKLDLAVLQGASPELVEATICSKDWLLSDVPSPRENFQKRNEQQSSTFATANHSGERTSKADTAQHDSSVEIPRDTSPNAPCPNKFSEEVISISENSQETPDKDEQRTKTAMHQVVEKIRGKVLSDKFKLGLDKEEILAIEIVKQIEPNVIIVKMDRDIYIGLTGKWMNSLVLPSSTNGEARWLVDEVIDAYINIINLGRYPSRKVLIVSSVDTQLLRGDLKAMCKTTSKIRELGTKFLNDNLVFFPINVGNHWIVGALNFIRNEFQILDSKVNIKYSANQNPYKSLTDKLCSGIQDCIKSMCDVNGTMQDARSNQVDIARRNVKLIQIAPQQSDDSSCALFALRYMQFWDGNSSHTTFPSNDSFSQKNMEIFRKKIVAELIMSELNLMKVVPQEIRKLLNDVKFEF